jgi:CDGSH-type Zn-finger protein
VYGDDGRMYEVRNRMMLCRCGASENKPFCDGSHASIGFKDEKVHGEAGQPAAR